MRRIKLISLIVLSLVQISLFAQGMVKSSGIGFRAGFWNTRGRPLKIRSDEQGLFDSTIEFNGIGGSINFFSRVQDRLFLNIDLDAIPYIHVEKRDLFEEYTRATTLIPILFGLRYDLLPIRMVSPLQPYICSGIGPYWEINTQNRQEGLFDKKTDVSSNLYFGGYIGTGVHFNLKPSWALSLSLQYHFCQFETDHTNSGLAFNTGFCYLFGKERELFRVKEIRMIVKDIYPVYYSFYNTYPLALISIQNRVGYPIEVNVHTELEGFSERKHESGFTSIESGKTQDIPIHAVFGNNILQTAQRKTAIMDLEIEVRAGVTHRKQLSAELVIHSRNSWNGEMDKLRLFLTPEDPMIREFILDVIEEYQHLHDEPPDRFQFVRQVFNRLQTQGIDYHPDPNIPFYGDDRVQFASETLKLGRGDCDDLVVLVASLLESYGIPTSFIEVHHPKKELAHLYILFQTGLTPSQGHLISHNEKRYVIRENSVGEKFIWIPLETTLLREGFESAWKSAALAYLEEGIYQQGLVDGWVRIIE